MSAKPTGRTKLLRALFAGPPRRVRAGTRIFWPGEPARNLFFLASGMVTLTDVSPAGAEIIIHLYRPGEIFGERCFLNGGQQYSATALEHSDILEIPVYEVIEHVRTRPDTLLELLAELSGRLADTNGEFQAFVSESVVVRLGTKLLALAAAPEDESGWLNVPHGFRHEELAQMLGVQRETVTRAIATLRKRGLVTTAGRGPIRIHPTEMRRFLSRECSAPHLEGPSMMNARRSLLTSRTRRASQSVRPEPDRDRPDAAT